MLTPIIAPKVGMSTSGYKVVKWLQEDGRPVQAGEVVVVIETSKVAEEIPAPAAGLVFRLKEVLDEVKPGDELGLIADSAEEFASRPQAGREAAADSVFFEDDDDQGPGLSLSFEDDDGDDAPAPAAGRTAGPAPAPVMPPPLEMTEETVGRTIPFVGMRRAIADNLWTSLQSGAQLTVVSKVDVTELSAFRRELRLDMGRKITFVDMLVKLLAVALGEFPILNSSITTEEIVCWKQINIGVAVAVENGLVVPVVRRADKKGLAAVSREISRLSDQARRGELKPENYQGGTFTLSSGGKVDVDFMTPIINPPQNAILGLGKIAPQPAVHEGRLAVRTMTHLCLTHDHRAVDGVPAGLFVTRLKQLMETPSEFRKVLG